MVCLVTGSSRGLGRAVALEFGKKGYKVILHYKDNKESAEEAASHIAESMVLQADVRKAGEVKALVDNAVNTFGGIDILVNNAGITKESLLLRTSEADFDDVLNTNLKGPFNFMRAAGRSMMKRKGGHIINISSYAGIKGKAGLSAYSASKAGLTGLTKTAAKELARYNIMVNAVLPGYMLTDMGSESAEQAKEDALKESLVKDFSDPEKVAAFICSLTDMKGITGQVFNLDSRII